MENGETSTKGIANACHLTLCTTRQYVQDILVILRLLGYDVANRADLVVWLFRPEVLKMQSEVKLGGNNG